MNFQREIAMIVNTTSQIIFIYSLNDCVIKNGVVETRGLRKPVFPEQVYNFSSNPAKIVDGSIRNLPEPKPGVKYIVTLRIKEALPNRKDLLVPKYPVFSPGTDYIIGYLMLSDI